MAPDDEELADISPHIRLRIDPRKKKEWLEYAEEHHHGNLTSLIKTAVNHTIDDEWVLADTHHPERDIDTSELEDGVAEISNRLSVIERKVDDLTLQSSDEPAPEFSRDALIKLANRCHDLLPRLQSEVQFPTLHHSLSIQLQELPDDFVDDVHSERGDNPLAHIRARVTGRAEDLGDALDTPVHQVRQALIFLEQSETGSLVESAIDEGERRWYIRDPDAEPDFSFLEVNQPDEGTDGSASGERS